MAKSLAGLGPIDVEFTYKNRKYSSSVMDHLVLDDLNVDEIKTYLNELPARVAFWKGLLIKVEREYDDLNESYAFWFQNAYMDVDAQHAKRTEGWKKSKVMLDNPTDYRDWKRKLRDLADIGKKINVLVSGYNNQIWTLREIARLTESEINNLSASSLKKRGSLADH